MSARTHCPARHPTDSLQAHPTKKRPHLAHNYHLPAQNCLVSNLHQTGLRFRIGNSQSRKPFLFPVPFSLPFYSLLPSPRSSSTPYPPPPRFFHICLKPNTLRILTSTGLSDNKRVTRRTASEKRHFSSENGHFSLEKVRGEVALRSSRSSLSGPSGLNLVESLRRYERER